MLAFGKGDMTKVKGEIREHFDVTDLGSPQHFDVTDLGSPQHFVGIEISRNRSLHTITLSQFCYIQTILERFHMSSCTPVRTPLDSNNPLISTPSTEEPLNDVPYAALIGSLMYAAVATRPDISFAVQHLSQFTSRPSQAHWTATKRVLRYLKGTQNFGLSYGKSTNLTLHGFSDADWGSNHTDRRSTSGYVYLLAGGAITWSSKKQPTVALSSMEAEYMALCHATKEAIWLRSLSADLKYPITDPTIVSNDNQSAIAYSQDDQFHA